MQDGLFPHSLFLLELFENVTGMLCFNTCIYVTDAFIASLSLVTALLTAEGPHSRFCQWHDSSAGHVLIDCVDIC